MYLLERLLHNAPFARKQTDGLVALTINYILSQFAVGMVATFGVLYVFQLGFNLFEGLTFILVFFGLQRIVVGLINSFVSRFIAKVGYRWAMLVGLLAYIAKLSLLSVSTRASFLPIFPALVMGGIATASYYLAYHALFLDDNDEARIGEQDGALTMFGRLAMVVSPFIAGVIIDKFGFDTMFTVANVLVVISAVPLFLMKNHKRHAGSYSYGKVREFIKENPKVSKGMIWWYVVVGIQAVYWPIYLFLVLGSYTIFGVVSSVVIMINAVSLFLVGKAYDRRRHKRLFVGSSIALVFTWIARFTSVAFSPVLVSDSLAKLVAPAWWMKIRRQELLAGEKVDSLVFGAAHEQLVTIGTAISITAGYALLVLSGGKWLLLVIPVVFGTLYSAYIMRDE